MKTSEILAEARSIVKRGWCKHVTKDWDRNHCAIGAICLAERRAHHLHGVVPRSLPVFPAEALETTVVEHGYANIVQFNDDPRTTKQDVLDMFDKTIAKLEERGW